MKWTDDKIALGNEELNKFLDVKKDSANFASNRVATKGYYHVDWNWLMRAVQKINEEQQCKDAIRDLSYTISYLLSGYYGYTDFKRVPVTMTLENLWHRVVMYAMHVKDGKPIDIYRAYFSVK